MLNKCPHCGQPGQIVIVQNVCIKQVFAMDENGNKGKLLVEMPPQEGGFTYHCQYCQKQLTPPRFIDSESGPVLSM